jgi:hypothetical protein
MKSIYRFPVLITLLALAADRARADDKIPAEVGAPRDQSFLFLQGRAPGDWLDRQKWAPGFTPDSARRLQVAYTQLPGHQADPCCLTGPLSGAFQSPAWRGAWGGYLDLDRFGFDDNKNQELRENSRRLAGEAGLWVSMQSGPIKGAQLAFGADQEHGEVSATDRTGDFAGIRNFSKHDRQWQAVSGALLVSVTEHRHLRLSSSLAKGSFATDSGNEVRYDNEAFRRFNSSEIHSVETSFNHFGTGLDFIISRKDGSLIDLRARALLKDGHDSENQALGDSSKFQVGGSWLRTLTYHMLEYQIAPGADFEVAFFNTAEKQDVYLGLLMPLDEDRSRKTLALRVPQRIAFSLSENMKLLFGWDLSLTYWSEKNETPGTLNYSSAGADLEFEIKLPTLYVGHTGPLSMALTPTGRLNSPGGILEISLTIP